MRSEMRLPRVFFYGLFMEVHVLAEHGVIASESVPARVSGFELTIRPRVNLAPADRSCAYGGLVAVAHKDLARIYTALEERFGVTYLPEAVLAETLDGALRPALCYVAPNMKAGPADPAFVGQLASCVRRMALPEWYAIHVESFAWTKGVGG